MTERLTLSAVHNSSRVCHQQVIVVIFFFWFSRLPVARLLRTPGCVDRHAGQVELILIVDGKNDPEG